MEAGRPRATTQGTTSPIVRALAQVERITTAEIRVHLTRKVLERDPFATAESVFKRFQMTRTTHRNGVLIYVNLRTRRFAIAADVGAQEALGRRYWDELARALAEDLRSTHPENAIAIAVRTLGVTLHQHFPIEDTDMDGR